MPQFDYASFKRYWKYKKFQRFFKNHLFLSSQKFSTNFDLKNYRHDYDLVIAGSDQIWCVDSFFRGFDPSFFLDFAKTETTASYAVSCGSSNSFSEHKSTVKRLVKDITYVSVRDQNSLNLVEKECDRDDVTLVVDPTFLGDYSTLIRKPNLIDRYLLIYKHGSLTQHEQRCIQHFSQENNLAIASVGTEVDWADYNFAEADPQEWLGLMQQADYVITNTFHGTIFSLLFRRSFTVVYRPSKQNKTQDLLNRFGLEERIIDFKSIQSEKFEGFKIPMSTYEKLWKKFSPEVKRSKSFLMKCLQG